MARTAKVSIIALDKFIQATRDSGYRGTVSALSELVDNSIQASARNIQIWLTKDEDTSDHPVVVAVLDDGSGMDRSTLRQALRFGGSSRFNDRGGLGRYGMGLPNASLSQARRVEVFTWQERGSVLFSYLDVDEIASGKMTEIPLPRRQGLPDSISETPSRTGTLVVWRICDRLENRRISTLERRLKPALGRIFRHFLWDRVSISVNGDEVQPLDPLYVRRPSVTSGGRIFQEPIAFEVKVPSSNGDRPRSSEIVVTFSELPVELWHELPNEEKRELGITNGAGVSVVRGGREIDYGWFFLGGKRRENYDDWWRAEIKFDPVLDELFGITHTKQQVRPQESLIDILESEMGEMARVLNGRVRDAHVALKSKGSARAAEEVAMRRDVLLKPLPPSKAPPAQHKLAARLRARHPEVLGRVPTNGRDYVILEEDLGETSFFVPVVEDKRVTLLINPKHRFYKQVYQPLMESVDPAQAGLAQKIQLLLLAASRAEASASFTERSALASFREEWSEVLSVLLKP